MTNTTPAKVEPIRLRPIETRPDGQVVEIHHHHHRHEAPRAAAEHIERALLIAVAALLVFLVFVAFTIFFGLLVARAATDGLLAIAMIGLAVALVVHIVRELFLLRR